MSRGSRMAEHPRVLVDAARLQAVEQWRGIGVSPRDVDWMARELVEDQDQMAEMDVLAR